MEQAGNKGEKGAKAHSGKSQRHPYESRLIGDLQGDVESAECEEEDKNHRKRADGADDIRIIPRHDDFSKNRILIMLHEKILSPFNNKIKSLFVLICLLPGLSGCATSPPVLTLVQNDISLFFEADVIVDAEQKKPLAFGDLLDQLASVDIVYVGERHTSSAHHAVQMRILEGLHQIRPDMVVGMEMFDRTYQPILDQWSVGSLDPQDFIEKVHWYANWKFDFALYHDLLDYIQRHKIQLFALNIPPHIPPRIAVGGIDNLLPADSRLLPDNINTSDVRHRAYVEKIHAMHHSLPGRGHFEYFYAAQCVWEDAMAQAVAENFSGRLMVVFIGTGHILHKFGVPDRAYARTNVLFKTVVPADTGTRLDLDVGDFIWVTAP